MNYNKIWMDTEYNTAVLTGEAAAEYYRLKKQANIFPYWKYRTMGDTHVREAHARLDGMILHNSAKYWNELFPPNGWNCRCFVQPLMKNEVSQKELKNGKSRANAYLKSAQYRKEKSTGWGGQ